MSMSSVLSNLLGSVGSVSDVLSPVFNSGMSFYNSKMNNEFNRQNLELQKENLQYQKDLQNQIFAREDNAVARRVADLKSVGLSPTLAVGSSAGAGSVVSTSAPQVGRFNTPEMKTINALNTATALEQLKGVETDNLIKLYDLGLSYKSGMRTTDKDLNPIVRTLEMLKNNLGFDTKKPFSSAFNAVGNVAGNVIKDIFDLTGLTRVSENLDVGNPLTSEGVKARKNNQRDSFWSLFTKEGFKKRLSIFGDIFR